MIPFCNGNAILTAIVGAKPEVDTLNDDYNWHLKNAPAQAPDSWLLRLLPTAFRNRIKARRAARAYEDALIAVWEKSPHLLDDIGVVLSTEQAVPEHLVPAPARVIDHVKAATEAKPLPAPEATETVAATPTPAAPARVRTAHPNAAVGLPA